jgi:CDP-glucose 4,6-dehydratase
MESVGRLMVNLDFYKGKKVFITGHTGFKGSWLCKILLDAGAKVTGYALEPPTNPNLFSIANIGKKMTSVIGDIRNLNELQKAFENAQPEIVFHLAAQPLVLESYKQPVYTYETNVMGTVNILECVRNSKTVKSFLNITTDKVYQNNEWEWGYRENDNLNGFDPYSNSKSCSELVTSSYKKSFFSDNHIRISTARAGNVIGGGDFSDNRIIPDCIRAAMKKENITVRNPNSIRPYQHVLEPLFAYLLIAEKQYNDDKYCNNYNIGPNDCDCITTGTLATIFCNKWGEKMQWNTNELNGPHEANFLKLDCSRMISVFNWKPTWNVEKAIEKTVEFSKIYINNGDIQECMTKQILEFIN